MRCLRKKNCSCIMLLRSSTGWSSGLHVQERIVGLLGTINISASIRQGQTLYLLLCLWPTS